MKILLSRPITWKGLVLGILLFPGIIFGQDVPNGSVDNLYDVSIDDLLNVGIVSASKKKQSVTDAPATAYVITELQIKERGYRTLIDVLEEIPEVEIQRNSNPEQRNVISVRGLAGSEKLLILQNGVRITPPTGDTYVISYNYNLDHVRRVEVILGPASALYGVDAFAGIVNIVTVNQEGDQNKEIMVRAGGGSYFTTDNSVLVTGKVDKIKFYVSGNGYYSDEPNYAEVYPDDYSWYNNQFVPNGKVVESPFYNDIYDIGYFQRNAGASFEGDSISREFAMPTSAVNINGEVTMDKFTIGGHYNMERHSSSYGVDSKYAAPARDAFVKQSLLALYVKHRYQSFNKKWNLQTMVAGHFYETNAGSNFQGSSSRWQRGYIYSRGQTFRLEENFDYAISKKLFFVAGGSFEYLTALPRTGLSPKPIEPNEPFALQDIYFIGAAGYDPYQTGDVAFNENIAIRQDFYELRYNNYGGYGQLQYTPLKWMDIYAGGRVDYNTRFGSTFNPRIGVVLSPAEKLRLKLLYGEAYLAPSPKKAYEQNGAFFGASGSTLFADYFRVVNPDLQPEKLRTMEMGASYTLNKAVSLSIDGFYNIVEDYIDFFGSAPDSVGPDNISATRLETSVNLGNLNSYGGSFKLQALFKTGKVKWTGYGSYSYMDGSIESDLDGDGTLESSALTFTALHSAKGGITASIGKFFVTPRVLYRSSSNSNLNDFQVDQYYQNKGFATLSLQMGYKVIDKKKSEMQLLIGATNLTNLKYYHVYSGNAEGMPLTPQDPLRINAGLQLKWK